MDGLAEDESCRFRPCTSSSVTEASGSGSTVSETPEIVNSARGMFNSGTFLNCTVNVNVNSKQLK